MRLSFYIAATISALAAQNYNSVVQAVKIDTMPPDTQSDSLGLAQTEQQDPSLFLSQTKVKAKSKSGAHQKAADKKDFVSPGEANKAVQDVVDQNH